MTTGLDEALGVWGKLARNAGVTNLDAVDFASVPRRPHGNDCLVAPAGVNAAADWAAPEFQLTRDDLEARIASVILADARTVEITSAAPPHRRRFVQRTALMQYPDIVDVEAIATGTATSTLALYSRSLIGRKDFGVNRARLTRWLAALGSKN